MCEHHGLRMFLTFICCYMFSNIPAVICAQITQMPQDVTISAGMEATFQCIFKMNRYIDEELTYDVAWYSAKWNSTLTKNRYSIEEEIDVLSDGKYVYSTLKITRVKHADKGNFVCCIIQKSTIQATALLTVKQVPEPQCMPLPRNVSITQSFTLSCTIGPGNYVTRLTWWYDTKYAGFIKSNQFLQQPAKSYLNTTVAVKDYDNGTTFKCVAENPSDNTMTETCSTNPLNIVENEPISLDVKVHALSTLPLTAGMQACFECKVSCDVGICHGLIEYTWAYHGSAKQLPRPFANRTCFESVPLSDDGKPLRCTAHVKSKKGVGELVLKVVDTMTTTQTEIRGQHPITATENTPSTITPNNGINNHLQNNDNNFFIPIAIVVIVILIFIILGLLFYYRKHKLRLKENINKTDEELHVNKAATQTESQNNQQQNSLSLDAIQIYAKVQKVDNLTTEKQNAEKLNIPQKVEINLMYESLEMNNLAQKRSDSLNISDLYARVDKTSKDDGNVKRSPVVTHWQSSSGDVYACVQKNKASTLPANQRRPASKHLPNTKPKLLKGTANQKTTNPNAANNTCEMATDRNDTEKVNEMAKTDNNGRKSQNEQTTAKENLDEKVTKQKASTMSPSSGHYSMSFDAQGLHYADLEFTNDPTRESTLPQSGGVIYADITKK